MVPTRLSGCGSWGRSVRAEAEWVVLPRLGGCGLVGVTGRASGAWEWRSAWRPPAGGALWCGAGGVRSGREVRLWYTKSRAKGAACCTKVSFYVRQGWDGGAEQPSARLTGPGPCPRPLLGVTGWVWAAADSRPPRLGLCPLPASSRGRRHRHRQATPQRHHSHPATIRNCQAGPPHPTPPLTRPANPPPSVAAKPGQARTHPFVRTRSPHSLRPLSRCRTTHPHSCAPAPPTARSR